MTQLFNISINGTDVTARVNGCRVSEEVNRFYDVASFTIDASSDVLLESGIVIHYGSRTFNGFVYSTSKTGKNSLSIECRTHSARLTEPYSSNESVLESATTSHALCSLFASKTGISITITSANLDFGGSYERRGTILSALSNIAAITGAEYWDNGSGITISPNKAITSSGTEIPDSDIFDFIPRTKSIHNNGVGNITIQNGEEVSLADSSTYEDIVSHNKIYAEIDECSGAISVFTNPYGAVTYTKGLSSLTATKSERKEEITILDRDVVYLDAAIDSISSVMLNGINITNYNFEAGHNVLYFTTTQRGTLSVSYIASGHKGYCNVSLTPIGRFVSFDVVYLDQILSFQGFLSEECGNDENSKTDGDMTCIVPKEMMYPKGFYFWTIGGVPQFTFYANSSIIQRSVSYLSKSYISSEEATLEKTDTGYRYQTRYPMSAELGARSAGVDVSYTTSTDVDGGTFFEFTQYYPRVSVSYSTPATEHYVKFTNIDKVLVTMVVKNTNTDQICEYDLEGIDLSDMSKIPCVLYQSVPVDIASQLGVPVANVAGRTLGWVKPNLSYDTGTVDNFGILKVYVDMDGNYVIDTGSIKKKTKVTLTSNVNG